MARSAFSLRLGSVLVVLALVAPAWGVQPTEKLLPATTKAYISTHDVDEVRSKFSESELGKWVKDPLMEPFIEDLKKQIGGKLEKAGMTFNAVDTPSFRSKLKESGYYAEWKGKYGNQAWSVLEESIGASLS